MPAAEIPARIGQAVESLELVPLLARALAQRRRRGAGDRGLARLIAGDLPLDDWVALVRTTVPPRARWRAPVRRGFWARVRARWSAWRGRSAARALCRHPSATPSIESPLDRAAVEVERVGHPAVD